ncbi:hypothetical protein B0G84_5023 [Paraburkholderia sp. BL8N3]|nr:hypothetical protein [Paraburkholderia sp. BL8N3]TCK39683.1 hypothetical protein B0G84_5023 [Paraburkholderia sp. BL8N3]
MSSSLLVVLAALGVVAWLATLIGCCAFIRGAALHEKKQREFAERKKVVDDWIASKNLQ